MISRTDGFLFAIGIIVLCITIPIDLFGQKAGYKSLQTDYQIKIKKSNDEIVLDGILEESSWSEADPAQDFWMSFPVDDERVNQQYQTEVKLTYNEDYLYVGAICYSSNDYKIQTLKRDSREFWSGDVFVVLLDPVNESSNGFSFGVNPAGVQYEALISGRTGTRAEMNTGNSGPSGFNTAWDNKWYVEVKQESDRWVVEMAIPFKTMRFDPLKETWGINFTRGEPRSNSWHTWSPVPVQFLTMDLGYTGAMIWDKPPEKVKSNISVIPFVLTSYDKDFESQENANYDLQAGVDAKIAVTSSLNLDITVNPDFSQVEVDEQVTNLTTFNIRFPEQRLFFLENSDLFSDFGITPMRPFFSRRIGLDEEGNTIPILYGLRLSGNVNKELRIGAMNMHTRKTEDLLSQNYTAINFHHRILERSVVKGYFNNRQAMGTPEDLSDDYNRTAGLEFNYFSQDAKWRGFGGLGMSFSDGFTGNNYFYSFGAGYDGKNFSIYSNLSGIGDNYYADMGWIPFADHYDAERDTTIHVGFNHLFTRMSYTFYPADQSVINSHAIGIRQILDVDNDFSLLQNRIEANYVMSFANTGGIIVEYGHESQQLLFPFAFTDASPLPANRYDFDYIKLSYQSDMRRILSGSGGFQYGSFYNGTRFETSLRLRYRVRPWGNIGLNFVYNKLEFPDIYGEENLFLIGPRVEWNFSRNLFWTTFIQYNTQQDNFNINSRIQWRFQPLSDLFVVYTDNYAVEIWGRKNHALVLKLNYWLNL